MTSSSHMRLAMRIMARSLAGVIAGQAFVQRPGLVFIAKQRVHVAALDQRAHRAVVAPHDLPRCKVKHDLRASLHARHCSLACGIGSSSSLVPNMCSKHAAACTDVAL